MPNSGGLQVGPRYLLPIVPVLALLALRSILVMREGEAGWLRWLVSLALVLGLVAQGFAVTHAIQVDRQRDLTYAVITEHHPEIILSKDPFAPCTLPDEVMAGRVLYLPEGSDYAAIEAELVRRGVKRIAMIRSAPREISLEQIFGRHVLRPAWDKIPENQRPKFRFGSYTVRSIHLTPSFPIYRSSVWIYER
jgi:hypothetical protein